jgi:hypothetical protein
MAELKAPSLAATLQRQAVAASLRMGALTLRAYLTRQAEKKKDDRKDMNDETIVHRSYGLRGRGAGETEVDERKYFT